MTTDCQLKICDFGLARVVEPHKILTSSSSSSSSSSAQQQQQAQPNEPENDGLTAAVEKQLENAGKKTLELMPKPTMKRMLTTHVVTRWYRCPELILLEDYTSAVKELY